MNRREFIGGAAAFGAIGKLAAEAPAPQLRLGVLSDIHIIEHPNEVTFEHALRWLDGQKADGVVICGDLADWGLEPQLQLVADTWYKVFPDNRRSDGAPIEKLFIYGDHDTGLNPKTLERLVKDPARRARESIPENDRKAIWERCFREPWEPIVLKDVKGYKFVLYNFNATQPNGDRSQWSYGQHAWGLPEFLERHAAELKGAKPFFYVQHRVLKGTAGGEWIWGQDDGFSTETLSRYPNCVAFCGHSHAMGTDERNVWQGAFTAIEVPSLSYLTTFCGRENGFGLWDGDFSKANAKDFWPPKQMPLLNVGGETRPVARHGYLVDVYPDRLRIERRCFVTDRDVGPDWTVPLPASAQSPFAHEVRAKNDPAPAFPDKAAAKAVRVKGKDRYGVETDQIVVSFPPANGTSATPRAYDYEVQPVLTKHSVRRFATAKRVYSSGILRAEEQDREPVTCVFAETEIPNDADFCEFVVTPLNAFGRRGQPLTVKLGRKR